MKVRLLKRYAGPRGNFKIGTVLDVDDETAACLIRANVMESLEPEPVETAVMPEVPERAVRRGPGRPKKV